MHSFSLFPLWDYVASKYLMTFYCITCMINVYRLWNINIKLTGRIFEVQLQLTHCWNWKLESFAERTWQRQSRKFSVRTSCLQKYYVKFLFPFITNWTAHAVELVTGIHPYDRHILVTACSGAKPSGRQREEKETFTKSCLINSIWNHWNWSINLI